MDFWLELGSNTSIFLKVVSWPKQFNSDFRGRNNKILESMLQINHNLSFWKQKNKKTERFLVKLSLKQDEQHHLEAG